MSFNHDLNDLMWFVSLRCPFTSKHTKMEAHKCAKDVYFELRYWPTLLKGVRNIVDYYEQKEIVYRVDSHGNLVKTEDRVIVTLGTNMMDICHPYKRWAKHFYTHLTRSNDIINETYRLLGIDAACKSIENELVHILESNSACVSRMYVRLIARFMCNSGYPFGVNFAGLNSAGVDKFKLCTYERIFKSLLRVGASAHRTPLRGPSECAITGKQFKLGTGSVTLIPQKGLGTPIARKPKVPKRINVPLPSLPTIIPKVKLSSSSVAYVQSVTSENKELPAPRKLKKETVRVKRVKSDRMRMICEQENKRSAAKRKEPDPPVPIVPDTWKYDEIFQPYDEKK